MHIIFRKLNKYWLISQVGLLLIFIRAALQWISLPRLLGWLHGVPISFDKDFLTLQAMANYVDRLLTMFPVNQRGNCLPRTLVLYGLARRYGFPVLFQCGIHRVNQELKGHAWLTLGSEPFLEPTPQRERFQVTYSFPKGSQPSSRPSDPTVSHRSETSWLS